MVEVTDRKIDQLDGYYFHLAESLSHAFYFAGKFWRLSPKWAWVVLSYLVIDDTHKKGRRKNNRMHSVIGIQLQIHSFGCYYRRVFKRRWKSTMAAESERQSYTHRSIICFAFIPPGKLGKQFKTVNHCASYLVGGGSVHHSISIVYGDVRRKKTLNRDIHLDILINKNAINAPGLGVCTCVHATHTHTRIHHMQIEQIAR